MKTLKNTEKEKQTSSNTMDGIDKFLDFLSLSVEGLKIVDSPKEFRNEYNLEWNLKRLFTAYYGENYIKDEQQDTFYDFCDAIKFDMDIWRDYCGITENRASKGIVFNTDGNIEYADGINHLKIYQTEKYGDEDFPYLLLLKHDKFVELLTDSSIYTDLKSIALNEIDNLDKYELSYVEDKIREIENDMPENIKNKEYRAWYLETQYTLNLIKTGIHEKLLTKSRDLKSFVYLIYLVFSHAGFEINKGTKFSDYLALYLGESEKTIDEYIKHALKDNDPLWESDFTRTKKLLAILLQIKSFKPKREALDSLSKSIWEKIPTEKIRTETSKEKLSHKEFYEKFTKEELLKKLSQDERTLYDQLEICFK